MTNTATATGHLEDTKALLIHHLRRLPEEVFSYWRLCAAVADALLNHWERGRVPWKIRAAKRLEVSKALLCLVRDDKVIRRCHPQYGRRAGVTISASFEKGHRPGI